MKSAIIGLFNTLSACVLRLGNDIEKSGLLVTLFGYWSIAWGVIGICVCLILLLCRL